MRWMSWVRKQPVNIMTKIPFYKWQAGNKKSTAWLIDKDGCLKEVNVLPAVGNVPMSTGECLSGCFFTPVHAAQTFAGGMRPAGAARLTGVLHYFTRGPDNIF